MCYRKHWNQQLQLYSNYHWWKIPLYRVVIESAHWNKVKEGLENLFWSWVFNFSQWWIELRRRIAVSLQHNLWPIHIKRCFHFMHELLMKSLLWNRVGKISFHIKLTGPHDLLGVTLSRLVKVSSWLVEKTYIHNSKHARRPLTYHVFKYKQIIHQRSAVVAIGQPILMTNPPHTKRLPQPAILVLHPHFSHSANNFLTT